STAVSGRRRPSLATQRARWSGQPTASKSPSDATMRPRVYSPIKTEVCWSLLHLAAAGDRPDDLDAVVAVADQLVVEIQAHLLVERDDREPLADAEVM